MNGDENAGTINFIRPLTWSNCELAYPFWLIQKSKGNQISDH